MGPADEECCNYPTPHVGIVGGLGGMDHPNMFVSADGCLAEYLCRVEFLGPLSTARARQLAQIHQDHSPGGCLVLQAARTHLQTRERVSRCGRTRP